MEFIGIICSLLKRIDEGLTADISQCTVQHCDFVALCSMLDKWEH